MIAGLLVALGLGFGLLQLVGAVAIQWGKLTGAESLPATLGWGLLLGLQGLALFAGGCLAAVGSPHGKKLGCAVALLCTVVAFYSIQSGASSRMVAPYLSALSNEATAEMAVLEQSPLAQKMWYVLPILFLACGAAGGAVGGGIWQVPSQFLLARFEPTADQPFQELKTGAGYHPEQTTRKPSPWAGPVAWGRVLLGIGVGCGLSLAHGKIIHVIQTLSEGYIRIQSPAQEALATRELFALAIIVGGVFAGATRPNGLKQGLLVGIIAGAAQALLASRMQYSGDQLFYIMLAALVLAPLGGWFGSGLIPPVGPPREVLSEPL